MDAAEVAIIIALISVVPASIAAVAGLLNRQKLGAIEISIDGRLTELLATTKRENAANVTRAFADGQKHARAEDRIATAAMADRVLEQAADRAAAVVADAATAASHPMRRPADE